MWERMEYKSLVQFTRKVFPTHDDWEEMCSALRGCGAQVTKKINGHTTEVYTVCEDLA